MTTRRADGQPPLVHIGPKSSGEPHRRRQCQGFTECPVVFRFTSDGPPRDNRLFPKLDDNPIPPLVTHQSWCGRHKSGFGCGAADVARACRVNCESNVEPGSVAE